MAARENQGLQISLIIFVMLTMVLAVTTYLFFHNYSEEQIKVAAADTKSKKADDDLRKATEELGVVKALVIGGKPEDAEKVETAEVVKKYEEMLAKFTPQYVVAYAEDTPERDKERKHPLPFLVEQTNIELSKKNVDVDTAKTENDKLVNNVRTITTANKGEVDAYHGGIAKHNADLSGEKTRYNAEITAKQDQVVKLAAAKDAAESNLNTAKQELQTMQNALQTKIVKLEEDNRKLATIQKDKTTQITESPQGKVVFVNQTNRTATINLGSLDGLRKQIVFSVYNHTDLNVAKARSKGKLEVIQIESGHSATCRILEDDFKNPFMPQDLIYSPIWQPGQVEHFALAGIFDVDGDGKSDRQLVVDLITSNGGVVDAQLEEKGKVEGKIQLSTQYLIVGDRPTDRTGNPEVIAGFTRMLNEADKLGVQQMPLNKFLLHVGYTPERAGKGGSSATSGTGSNPAGNNDFRPRTPPRGTGGGAFDK